MCLVDIFDPVPFTTKQTALYTGGHFLTREVSSSYKQKVVKLGRGWEGVGEGSVQGLNLRPHYVG